MKTSLTLGVVILAVLAPGAAGQDGDVREEIRRLDRALKERDQVIDALKSRLEVLENAKGTAIQARDQTITELKQELNRETLAERIDELQSSISASYFRQQGGQSAVDLGGYFDLEFRDDQANDRTTFDQHRLILQVGSTIVPNAISFRSEIEFEGGGADASFLSGNEILVEFGELHFNFDRAFNLKFGALLVPFGRFNYLHDSPIRDLTDRPLVNRRIIPTTWTDAGVGAYGAFDVGDFLTVDYNVILSNGLDDDFSSTLGSGFRGNRNSFRADNNDNKMLIGRLGLTPDLEFLDYVNFGFSYGFGKYDDRDRRSIDILALDWTIKWGPLEFIGEYAYFDLERGMDEVALGAPGGADGYYLQLNYHFFPESWVGASRLFTEESTFTLIFRYGTIDTDDSAVGIDRTARGGSFRDDLQRLTFGINFRPVEKTVFKLEYQWFPERDGIDDVANDRLVFSVASYF